MMPHYLLDAVMWSAMEKSEKMVVVAVLRHTLYRDVSTAQPLSLSFLAKYTGYSERQVERVLDSLMSERVLLEVKPPGKVQPRELVVQMDTRQWGRYKPTGDEHPEPAPSILVKPEEGSTWCPPKKNARNRDDLEQEEGVEEQAQDQDSAQAPPGLEEWTYPCAAEGELLHGGDMVNAVGHALAQDLAWDFCEACYAASPTLHCDERQDICLLAAEDLISRVTSDVVRNKPAYVWGMLHAASPSPDHLIGWHHWWALHDRNGPWPPKERK